MGVFRNQIVSAIALVIAGACWPTLAFAQRCDIPREAHDIWRCENGFVIGPENVIIRLPIPETDPEALYNAGVEAAQREDWRVAIAYFTAAHQRAHLVPRYMYNLGLAHARAGHSIPAVAWLAAYLAAAPDAPNRADVWAQVSQLEAAAQRESALLRERARTAAHAFPAAQPPDPPPPAIPMRFFTRPQAEHYLTAELFRPLRGGTAARMFGPAFLSGSIGVQYSISVLPGPSERQIWLAGAAQDTSSGVWRDIRVRTADLVDQGDTDAAITALEIFAARRLNGFAARSGDILGNDYGGGDWAMILEPNLAWRNARFDAIGLVAEYLVSKDQVTEALRVAQQLDSKRALDFGEWLRNRIQAGLAHGSAEEVRSFEAATLARATGGAASMPSYSDRWRVERQAWLALTLLGASGNTQWWLAQFDHPPSWADQYRDLMLAEYQFKLLALAAIDESWVLALIRTEYQRDGAVWGN